MSSRRRGPYSRDGRMQRLIGQFARFLVVGGISFAVDFGLFFVLYHYLSVQYILASTISFSLSLVLNYYLTLKFVFEARPDRKLLREFAIYIGLNIVALGLNQFILFLTVDTLGISPLLGKLVATAVVLIYNFISRKLLIERASSAPPGFRSGDEAESSEAGAST